MKILIVICVSAITALSWLGATPAWALNAQSWVASNGSDANPCTRSQPCATFHIAYDNTTAGGNIGCIDAANYGALTIRKAITIDCSDVHASVVLAGGIAFDIAAPGGDVVIRGLTIDGTGNSALGIYVGDNHAVTIESCRISGFRGSSFGQGIFHNSPSATNLQVIDTTLVNNDSAIMIDPQPTGSAMVSIKRTTMAHNNEGVRAAGIGGGGVTVYVRDSTSSLNKSFGFIAVTSAGGAGVVMALDKVEAILNGGDGLRANGNVAVSVRDSSFFGNSGTALNSLNGGQILTYGNNSGFDNTTNGAASAPLNPL